LGGFFAQLEFQSVGHLSAPLTELLTFCLWTVVSHTCR